MALSFTFGQNNHDTINLRLIDSTEQLIVPAVTYVTQGDSLSWIIDPGENVDTLNITGRRPHPFKALPVGDRPSIDVAVRPDAPVGQWKYKIIYRIKGNHHRYAIDPKIAVNPIRTGSNLTLIFGFIITLITSIFFGVRLLKANKGLREFRVKQLN